ncbi:RRXRR domain-containing protein [Nocardiopsis quinghaiensis]|uniref:RRXRR domain-containing protein n=1 Tax=Nocardiopsis quinghaiensis TaxID=464995 RepID=UPI001CC26BF3|nr:RRXRR domain-containing protein [Nocardiopsis quinghaiensis]
MLVVDEHDVPFPPTCPARARRLLETGRAAVARRTPFTVRVKDRTAKEAGASFSA